MWANARYGQATVQTIPMIRKIAASDWAKIFALLIGAEAVALVAGKYVAPATTDLAYVLGYNFAFWLLCALVLWSLAHSTSARVLAVLGSLVVYGTLASMSFQKAQWREEQTRIAGAEIQKAMIAASDLASSTLQDNQSPTSQAQGDMGEVSLLMQQLAIDSRRLRREYLSQLKSIGWSSSLSAEALAGDGGLALEKTRITSATSIIEDFRKRSKALVTGARDRMHSTHFSDTASDPRFVAGFDKGLAKQAPALDAVWQTELILVNCVSDIVAFLGKL